MITSRLIFRLFPGRFTVMNNAVITSWDMNCFVSSPCIPTLEQAALTEGTFKNVNSLRGRMESTLKRWRQLSAPKPVLTFSTRPDYITESPSQVRVMPMTTFSTVQLEKVRSAFM